MGEVGRVTQLLGNRRVQYYIAPTPGSTRLVWASAACPPPGVEWRARTPHARTLRLSQPLELETDTKALLASTARCYLHRALHCVRRAKLERVKTDEQRSSIVAAPHNANVPNKPTKPQQLHRKAKHLSRMKTLKPSIRAHCAHCSLI